MIWSKEEVELLKNEYLAKGEYNLSKLINKSPNAIRIKAFRLNISKLAQKNKVKLYPLEKQEPYLLWKINLLSLFPVLLKEHFQTTNK